MINPSNNLQRVADFFLAKAQEDKKPISNKKLQKLVYYAQAWNLVINNATLYNDPIEAWVHGPAVRSLYAHYKKYGFMFITEKPKQPIFDVASKLILEEVWTAYGKFDADYLEELSHSETPWLVARGSLDINDTSSAIIDTGIMKTYYSGLLK